MQLPQHRGQRDLRQTAHRLKELSSIRLPAPLHWVTERAEQLSRPVDQDL